MSDDPRDLSSLEAKLAELRKRLLAGFPERADSVRSAIAAVQEGAPEAREDLRRAAHKLRGVAATYGLRELTALAAEVEEGILRGESDDIVARAATTLADAIDAAR